MCDTFIALADATIDGSVIFGKNSDRPAGEIQDIVTFPAQSYPKGQQVQCTYIEIPQLEQTFAVVLSKPRWMWGAEMGANECGVVLGNEAVWTTQPCQPTGLLGMDLVRLGLERGGTAFAAVQVIINLLEQYGQGGNCAEHFSFTYHNSFLIADCQEAWVVETAGRYWVTERVTQGTRSISNNLSIRGKGDLRHPEMIADAIAQKLCSSESEFDFTELFSEGGIEDSLSLDSRAGRVRSLCRLHQGQFTIETAKSILRDHQGHICMHGEFETRGSQISRLSSQSCEHWLIDHPFPCQREYKRAEFPETLAVTKNYYHG
ncbi:peptidase C69 [Leptolyngbya sp. 'hensonii']|uniref:C69 family dipeptidase n=1 Tax=Leptolyngbya sp. 'hensonii' TaxID=1922337 RepID=UPI0009502E95|nr:C69 family dipeptidase [Leptolyngbya sp. 'hensonii']OLP17424.1 peptidase C69 [Leptolyngbya sp. 'hensonii']